MGQPSSIKVPLILLCPPPPLCRHAIVLSYSISGDFSFRIKFYLKMPLSGLAGSTTTPVRV